MAKGTKSIASQGVGVFSETGSLKKVFIHTPGKEVELMTPRSAEESLYNDIIYNKNISKGHSQLKSVLSLVSTVYEVSTCLAEVLKQKEVREEFLNLVLLSNDCLDLKPELMELPSKDLAQSLIVGIPLKKNSLESFLSSKTFSLPPLPNLYFMRDSSMVVSNRVITAHMANPVRNTESLIMRTIFKHHPEFNGCDLLLDGNYKNDERKFSIEGGDVLVVNENLLLIGISERTTVKAIDTLIENLILSRHNDKKTEPFHVLGVMLPRERNTIHLDMIFTLVNKEQAVVYAPYILGRQRAHVIKVSVMPDGHKKYEEIEDLILALQSVGQRIDPILCGGKNPLHQQREQWNSGSNLFSFAPGKVISYTHEHTLHACESAGFKIISAKDVIKHPTLLQSDSPILVAIEGSELSRGGGGPRCMTCPVLRV